MGSGILGSWLVAVFFFENYYFFFFFLGLLVWEFFFWLLVLEKGCCFERIKKINQLGG